MASYGLIKSLVLMVTGIMCSAQALAETTLIITRDNKANIETYVDFRNAIIAAKKMRMHFPQASIEIRLGKGVTFLSEPVVIGPELSGMPNKPTVITAEKGTRPELRAARSLKLDWRPYKDGIWVARLNGPDFDQLWINDRKQILARYPNFDAKITPLNGYSSDALSPERAARWRHPEDGVVRAIHNARWGGVIYRIEGRNPDGNVKLSAPAANNRVTPPMDTPHKEYRFVEGLFEELDSPGEWFFDRRTHDLYYMPRSDVDMGKASVEITTASRILHIGGTRAQPVHDLIIDGLSFSRSKDTLLEADEPLLRSDWKITRQGAILIEGAERVRLRNSDFHDLGGQGVFVSGYNRNVDISGNLFKDIGGTAISFVGLPSSVRSPAFEYAQSVPLNQMDKVPGPRTDDYPRQSSSDDNLITQIGLSDKQAAGIEISMAMDITLSYNSIYRVPRAGINISEGTFGGHILEHNDVFDTVLESGDHGAFNSWGRDRFWMADREAMNAASAADPTLPFLDVVKPIIVRNNRFRSDHGWDIDLDDGSSNYEIYNNLLLSGGLKLREGFRRKVYNNILINNSFHPHVWFRDSQDSFERNIVMGPYQPIQIPDWGKAIDYNLFVSEAALKQAQKLGLDVHSKTGDAHFIDPIRGDFRIKSTSPAVALGFKSFAMAFGVRSPRLKAMALTPDTPVLITDLAGKAGIVYDYYGAQVKSVETLGEQSAAGLPDISGVLVIAVAAGSAADQAGFKAGDVILTLAAGDVAIKDVQALLSATQGVKWHGELIFRIQRNQTRMTIRLKV